MQSQETPIAEETLSRFVDAALEVQSVTESYAPRLQAATDPAEQQALVEEANGAIHAAIDATDGITVQEYVAVGEAVQQDPALAQRLTAMAQARVAERQPS